MAIENEENKYYNNYWKGAFLDVLVEPKDDKSILYSGFLADYSICKDSSKLEHIYLAGTRIGYKKTPTDRFNYKEFKSKLFIIPYERVVNINIRKVYVKKVDKETPEKKEPSVFRTKDLIEHIYPLLVLFLVEYFTIKITFTLVNELSTFILLVTFSTILVFKIYVLIFLDSINQNSSNSGLIERSAKSRTNFLVFLVIYFFLVCIYMIKANTFIKLYKYFI